MDQTPPIQTLEEAQQLAEKLTQFMVDKQITHCLCCAESMGLVSRTMNKQLAGLLIKISTVVYETATNDVVPAEFTGKNLLNRTQYNNLNVLKKHGLIAKLKSTDDKKIHYCLTKKGYNFVTGQIAIPKTVWSFRNKTVRKSEEMVTIQDIQEEPYTDIRDSLFFQAPEIEEVEVALVHHKVKKKKRKDPCPMCSEGTLKRRMTAQIVNSVAVPTYWLQCTNCGYKKQLT